MDAAFAPTTVQVYRWRFDDPLQTAKRMAIAEGSGIGLAVDDAHLYWSAQTDGGGGIYRLAK